MNDLIDRAVELGLELADCQTCDGGGALNGTIPSTWNDFGHHCVDGMQCIACNGTGLDHSPAAVLLACWGQGEIIAIERGVWMDGYVRARSKQTQGPSMVGQTIVEAVLKAFIARSNG